MSCTACGRTGHEAASCPREHWKFKAQPPRTTPAMITAVEEALREAEETGRVISSIRARIDELDRLPEQDPSQDPPFQF